MALRVKVERLRKAILYFIDEITKPGNPTATALLGIFSVCWGAWVANPFWDVFLSAPAYGGFHALAPEWVWGSFIIIWGLALICSAAKLYITRIKISLAAVGWFWFIVSIMFLIGDWHSTGAVTYFFVSFYAMSCLVNLMVNHPAHLKL